MGTLALRGQRLRDGEQTAATARNSVRLLGDVIGARIEDHGKSIFTIWDMSELSGCLGGPWGYGLTGIERNVHWASQLARGRRMERIGAALTHQRLILDIGHAINMEDHSLDVWVVRSVKLGDIEQTLATKAVGKVTRI